MSTYNNHTTKTTIRFYLDRKYRYCACKPYPQHKILLVQFLINTSGERVRQRERERVRARQKEREKKREKQRERERYQR